MTNAEHLIENAIRALNEKESDIWAEMDKPVNKIMLEETGFRKEDIVSMACHIVYSLYLGMNPFSKEWEELMDGYDRIKEIKRYCTMYLFPEEYSEDEQ